MLLSARSTCVTVAALDALRLRALALEALGHPGCEHRAGHVGRRPAGFLDRRAFRLAAGAATLVGDADFTALPSEGYAGVPNQGQHHQGEGSSEDDRFPQSLAALRPGCFHPAPPLPIIRWRLGLPPRSPGRRRSRSLLLFS